MSLRIANITFDTPDPQGLSGWWVAALEGEVTRDLGDFVFVRAGGLSLGFQRGERGGAGPVHVDLVADDREAEVARLVSSGASLLREHVLPNGFAWTVLADPEGNRFCVSSGH